jgi:hypothetical protein
MQPDDGSLIVRVVSVAPHRARQFVVLSCAGTSFTSFEADSQGQFVQQFVFTGVGQSPLHVLLFQKALLFQKRLGTAVVDQRALAGEKVCAEAVAIGQQVVQLLLLKTTRREDEAVPQPEHVVDEEDDFVVIPSVLLQEERPPEARAEAAAAAPQQETLSSFLERHPLCCTQCGDSSSKGVVWLDCLHIYCRKCFAECVASGARSCPGNSQCAPFPDWALRRVLSDGELAQLDRRQMEETLSLVLSSSERVQCPRCSYTFLADQGGGGPEAAKFRCRECLLLWCASCGVTPFHDGRSCAQHADYARAPKCRFCRAPCDQQREHCADCADRAAVACTRRLAACGHRCGGVAGEDPCLAACYECSEAERGAEFCAICYVEEVRAQPAVQLACGHQFHFLCLVRQLESGYPRLRITFSHICCPLCKHKISCPALPRVDALVRPWLQLEQTVTRMAATRLVAEGRLREAQGESPESFAMRIYAYYACQRCKAPFFAGLAACGEAEESSELLCGDCARPAGGRCRHPQEFHMWKCRFCCSVASFRCWTTHSFCQKCHARQVAGEFLSRQPPSAFPVCAGPSVCPLGVKHGHCEETFLGCSMCKSLAGF